MDEKRDLPKRKSTRLKGYDYSSTGVYFVTICVRDRMCIFSETVRSDLMAADDKNGLSVGEEQAPPLPCII